MVEMNISSPAKINLYLHITDKNSENYHILDSLMCYVNVCDKISINARDDNSGNKIMLSGDFASSFAGEDAESNLVLRAAKKLFSFVKKDINNLTINLEKNIPVGAGLGGGSSNAASILSALNAWYGFNLSGAKLDKIALELGSDIPFFLRENSASYVSGIGEVIDEIPPLPKIYLVLVNPSKFLSTRDVYQNFDMNFSNKVSRPDGFHSYESLIKFLSNTQNDLQRIAVKLEPEIDEVLESIKKQENCDIARMSGSGATCFGIFKSEELAIKAADKIKCQNPDWWVVNCRTY